MLDVSFILEQGLDNTLKTELNANIYVVGNNKHMTSFCFFIWIAIAETSEYIKYMHVKTQKAHHIPLPGK